MASSTNVIDCPPSRPEEMPKRPGGDTGTPPILTGAPGWVLAPGLPVSTRHTCWTFPRLDRSGRGRRPALRPRPLLTTALGGTPMGFPPLRGEPPRLTGPGYATRTCWEFSSGRCADWLLRGNGLRGPVRTEGCPRAGGLAQHVAQAMPPKGTAVGLPGRTRTRASARNALFLRIFLKISVSSSLASSSSSLEPAAASAEASAPVVPGEVWPGSGVSMAGSSACSISHSMAWGTDMLKGKKPFLPTRPGVPRPFPSPQEKPCNGRRPPAGAADPLR